MGSAHSLGRPPFLVLFFPPRSSPTSHPPGPFSPHPPGVCLFLPFAVLLQLSCAFCFALLLFCLPGLGSVCFLPLPSPLSLPLFCLLVVCPPCLFFAFVASPVFPLLVAAGRPCSLPPSLHPLARMCKIPKYRSVGVGVFSIT